MFRWNCPKSLSAVSQAVSYVINGGLISCVPTNETKTYVTRYVKTCSFLGSTPCNSGDRVVKMDICGFLYAQLTYTCESRITYVTYITCETQTMIEWITQRMINSFAFMSEPAGIRLGFLLLIVGLAFVCRAKIVAHLSNMFRYMGGWMFWECSQCTLINHATCRECVACGGGRGRGGYATSIYSILDKLMELLFNRRDGSGGVPLVQGLVILLTLIAGIYLISSVGIAQAINIGGGLSCSVAPLRTDSGPRSLCGLSVILWTSFYCQST